MSLLYLSPVFHLWRWGTDRYDVISFAPRNSACSAYVATVLEFIIISCTVNLKLIEKVKDTSYICGSHMSIDCMLFISYSNRYKYGVIFCDAKEHLFLQIIIYPVQHKISTLATLF